jgi:hypothetical protein
MRKTLIPENLKKNAAKNNEGQKPTSFLGSIK